MTRLEAGVGALLAAAAVAAVAPAPQGPPQFAVTASGVAVPVRVRMAGRPVSGLVADDFEVTDRGVRQEVRAVEGRQVPIDLSLVVERTTTSRFLRASYERETAEAVRLLAPADRLRVVTYAHDVWEDRPLSAPMESVPAREAARPTTAFSLYDAVASAMMRPPAAGRQHVVLVLTGGINVQSMIGADVLAALAARSEAQVHVLVTRWTDWGTRSEARALRGISSSSDWDEERRAGLWARARLEGERYFEAVWNDDRERLVRVAQSTGGGELRASAFTGSIAGPVRQVLEDARSGYILYYQPRGVPEPGWHPIEVRVTRPGRYDVEARPGYLR